LRVQGKIDAGRSARARGDPATGPWWFSARCRRRP